MPRRLALITRISTLIPDDSEQAQAEARLNLYALAGGNWVVESIETTEVVHLPYPLSDEEIWVHPEAKAFRALYPNLADLISSANESAELGAGLRSDFDYAAYGDLAVLESQAGQLNQTERLIVGYMLPDYDLLVEKYGLRSLTDFLTEVTEP